MHELINLALIALVGLCLYRAHCSNLFQCALLLGRTLFAFLTSMALCEPLYNRAAPLVKLPAPYVRGIAFFSIWVLVLWGFQQLALSVLKETGREMRFRHQSPGQAIIGLLSGLLVSSALCVNLIMLPVVEGLYFENESQPVVGLHQAAAATYRTLTLSSADMVTLAQMEAGAHWAKEKMGQLLQNRDLKGAKRLVSDFEARYRQHTDTREVRERREELLKELSDALES